MYYVHGGNIETKLNNEKSKANRKLLKDIKKRYEQWKRLNEEITGITDDAIIKRVELLNDYKNFIDSPKYKKEKGNQGGFTSQSKLHSTVLEEFMYFLFKDIPRLQGKYIEYGPANAYANLYFAPANIDAFEKHTGITINTKNQDFAISKEIIIKSQAHNDALEEFNRIYVPIVSIECKTYIDKTMLEGSVATAEKIKRGNPYSLFLIVTETYDVSMDVDPKYSQIDQIYVLRKQTRRGGELHPFANDVVIELFQKVERHIATDWKNIETRIDKGLMI
ncbi:MAG: Bpu10I family restriction endonuclease [Planctomycetota bacterium]